MQIVNVICCQGNFYGHLTRAFKDQVEETLMIHNFQEIHRALKSGQNTHLR